MTPQQIMQFVVKVLLEEPMPYFDFTRRGDESFVIGFINAIDVQNEEKNNKLTIEVMIEGGNIVGLPLSEILDVRLRSSSK